MKLLHVRRIEQSDLEALSVGQCAEEAMRILRAPLLAAFDIYKSNVSYGMVTETEAEHKAVAKWYRLLLDLEPAALGEIPASVARYLEGVRT